MPGAPREPATAWPTTGPVRGHCPVGVAWLALQKRGAEADDTGEPPREAWHSQRVERDIASVAVRNDEVAGPWMLDALRMQLDRKVPARRQPIPMPVVQPGAEPSSPHESPELDGADLAQALDDGRAERRIRLRPCGLRREGSVDQRDDAGGIRGAHEFSAAMRDLRASVGNIKHILGLD